ncbi:hypothetical protein THARTR1_05727 [Trichoderma harzianum]|uniref:Uncharacterized protein n=1 Tax=Trichoderma harzianum TaxID=5544 RepID=A0A2K0U809_TRIHA|nr:hypothetical protein THARTR1_05727 [Trichoderma harzianum]
MSDKTPDGPPSLEELFKIVCDHGLGGPFLEKFYSPSGLGTLGTSTPDLLYAIRLCTDWTVDDWPKGTSTWCWIKADIMFYQVVPAHIRDRYKTQESINEALDMLYKHMLTYWPAAIGTDYMDSDEEIREVERDGPDLVHTVPNTPDGSEDGDAGEKEDMGK